MIVLLSQFLNLSHLFPSVKGFTELSSKLNFELSQFLIKLISLHGPSGGSKTILVLLKLFDKEIPLKLVIYILDKTTTQGNKTSSN